MPNLIKPVHMEDVWLEGAEAPPSLASRLAVVGLVLGCVFAVFFLIGHATTGGGAQAEQPAGTVVGSGQATIPGGLKGVAALGPLAAPRPTVVQAPVTAGRSSSSGEAAGGSSEAAGGSGSSEATRVSEPEVAKPAPAPTVHAAPKPSSGGGHSTHSSGGGGSFDSSG